MSTPDTPPTTQDADQPLRILVVDDNADAAESLALLLEMHGHQAQTAGDATTALDAAGQLTPELIFLDIGLPGIDGYELGRRLRTLPALAAARIVALSGHGTADDRRRSREAGFAAHLQKPIDLGELPAIIARAMATRA